MSKNRKVVSMHAAPEFSRKLKRYLGFGLTEIEIAKLLDFDLNDIEKSYSEVFEMEKRKRKSDIAHVWLRKKFPKPYFCVACGRSKKKENWQHRFGYFQWACIFGYEKKRENYRWLCQKCHTRFDYLPGMNPARYDFGFYDEAQLSPEDKAFADKIRSSPPPPKD